MTSQQRATCLLPPWPRTSTRSEHRGTAEHSLGERALALSETAYGPEHPAVGTRLNNLAWILRELGDFAAARPLAERALALAETAYGPEHPHRRRGEACRNGILDRSRF